MPTHNRFVSSAVVAKLLFATVLTASHASFAAESKHVPTNPKIDAKAFLAITQEALDHREERRLTEADFMRMSAEPGTIVLDARSAKRFGELHIADAINLNFSDITAESLAKIIPSPNTRVLIYCNNNFANAPQAFPTKLPSASLNLSTFTALYNYGYRNVYELGPFVDVAKTKLMLVASK